MANEVYDWKRFWLPRGSQIPLLDNGYLYISELGSDAVPFDSINNTPCLVLLGEPGIGKSHALRAEQDALRIELADGNDMILALDLRSFGSEDRLVRRLFENRIFLDWVDGDHKLYLFLDSLDECLLRIDTLASLLIDELHSYTDHIDRLYLRLACRTADWRLTLETGLQELWGENAVGVFELTPLRRVDVIEAALSNQISPDEFLEEVQQKEVAPLAIKPVTLNFLFNIYQDSGQLPPTKSEIYHKGCLLLCEEPNLERRYLSRTRNLTTQQRLVIASRIAALTIFANRYAVWMDIDEGNVPEESLTIQEISGGYEFINSERFSIDEAVVKETLATGLFSSRDSRQLGWSHQTYAEFLAALYVSENMTTDQICSLLFHFDEKLAPQLHQTASWIAGFNRDIFWQIMRSEPQVLLNGDITTDDVEGKSALVEALLQLYDDQIIPQYSFTKYFAKLDHPYLENQLSAYISDNTKSANGWAAAIDIAEECRLPGLDEQLLKIALDSSHPLQVRINATRYVCSIGEETTKARLKTLVLVADQDSVADDLKYSALEAVWPKHITAKELFSTLVPPTEEGNIITLRASLLRKLTEYLKVPDLPVALAWVSTLPRRHDLSLDYVDLMDSVMLLAWQHFHIPAVQEAFAAAALSRVLKYDAIVGDSHRGWGRDKSHPDFAHDLQTDTEKRRNLFLILLTLCDDPKPLLSLIHYTPPLITHTDLEWLIICFQKESSELSRSILADIIKRFFLWNVQLYFDTVFNACSNDPTLDEALEKPFAPIELASEKAKDLKTALLKRKAVEDTIQREPPLDPPPAGQIALMLEKCEADDIRWWFHLTAALSLTPSHTRYHFDWHSDLTERPGWQNADEQIRKRIISLAKRYVVEEAPVDNDWFGTNSFPHGVLAGYQALRLLLQIEPQSLVEIPFQLWGQWTPIILRYPNESGEYQQILARIAYLANPDQFIENLLFLVDSEGSKGHIFSLHAIKKCWDQKLITALSVKLYDNQLSEDGVNNLLINLLEQSSNEARVFAESLIKDQDLSVERIRAKAVFAATALLTRVGEFNWQIIWPVVQSDKEFGRSVLENVAGQDRLTGNFPSQLNENDLANLYIWLTNEYPHAEDPNVKGIHEITPREEIGRFRDTILHRHLAERGTPQAIIEIRRIMQTFPHLELRHLLSYSLERVRSRSWKPHKPQVLLQITRDPQSLLVQNGDQLLGVLLDSLSRLQQKLIGETPAVRDVWDRVDKDKYRPVSENDLSDYVKRHFDDDIVQRGIVANREVHIRRGKERTDIHINAVIRDEQRQEYDVITAIIEVKGCWHPEVMSAMESQLLNRYLKNNQCQYGLYLVGWFVCGHWDDDDYRKNQLSDLSLDDMKKTLDNQATKLSQGKDRIDAYILDSRLP